MHDFLTEDTKAIILLCGIFGKERSEKPLTLREYSALVRWLIGVNLRPADLLQKEIVDEASVGSGIARQRLASLLGRGVRLGFAVEEWQRNGIWIISRSDSDYPARYKRHLRDKAPPLLFGVGNRFLLRGGGLGIVGSRDVDQAGEDFTRHVARLCAWNGMPVVSGGARGVDQLSMSAALEAGGVAIGVLAESLLKKSLERSARRAIADDRLLLLSPHHPDARFSVGTAMGRNKLIYALSDYALVVSAEHKKGGTWAGAEEELKRENAVPVFVRTGKDVPKGNTRLLDLGAIPWPDSIDRSDLRQQLHDMAARFLNVGHEMSPGLLLEAGREKAPREEALPDDGAVDPIGAVAIAEPAGATNRPDGQAKATSGREEEVAQCPPSIYQAVVPVLLQALDSPKTADQLAGILDVNKTQLGVWLKKAVEEKRIVKLSKPVRYRKPEPEMQGYLLQ